MKSSVDLKETISRSRFILTEAAVIETLRRDPSVSLHPRLENALLIYDEKDREALGRLYGGFMDLAQEADVPVLISTPT